MTTSPLVPPLEGAREGAISIRNVLMTSLSSATKRGRGASKVETILDVNMMFWAR